MISESTEEVIIRTTSCNKLILLFYFLLGICGLSAAVGLVFSFMVTAAYFDPGEVYRLRPLADPDVKVFLIGMLSSLPIAAFSFVGLFVTWRMAYKTKVMSLAHGLKRDYILSNEGVHTKKIKLRFGGSVYLFYPWASLSLYLVDERKKVIGLKGKSTWLKLRAIRNFSSIKSAILMHLPEKQRAATNKLPGLRWGILGLEIVLLIGLLIRTNGFYNGISTGKVGDGRCDICREDATLFGLGIAEKDKIGINRLVHEYCQLHSVGYATIHPAMAIHSLISTPVNKGQTETPSNFWNIFEKIIGAAIIWSFIVWLVITLALPAWRKTRILEE